MYLVMEMQSTDSGIATLPPTTHSTREEAESRFHSILASAAVSSVPIHTAIMIDEMGYPVRPPECYKHPPVVVEEPVEDDEE